MKWMLFFAISLSVTGYAQTRFAALSNYTEAANRSASEVNAIFGSINNYYPRVKLYQEGKHYTAPPRFDCGTSPEMFYIQKALTEGIALNDGGALNNKLRALSAAADEIDKKCKALDTYHKLEDYKRDNFKQAEVLVGEMQVAFKAYRIKQNELWTALESEFKKQPATGTGPSIVDAMMKKAVANERAFLDLITFNLNEKVHTGFPSDQLLTSIGETDKTLTVFSQTKPALEYPASSMYGSFKEALESMLTSKRSALDGYNFDAKQSDRHSNETYLELINYFNGTLVADQNTFVRFASSNGYKGVGTLNYVPMFEIKTAAKVEETTITPFQDIAYAPVNVSSSPTAIPNATADVLDNYITFINEFENQIERLTESLQRLNSDAAYRKGLASYKGKSAISFNHDDFKIPLSDYQKAVTQTAATQRAWKKTLDDQSTVLLNITKEMDQIASVLEIETANKSYEKDDLSHVYSLLEREAMLSELTNKKRDQLYRDVRRVFDSYAIANPAGSWSKSGKALLSLVDEERVQLFKARAYILGDTTSMPDATRIDAQVRDILSNEFSNLKGIENLGGSNGNDPYTPYEDVPKNARTYSKDLKEIRENRDKEDVYRGPYHGYQYMYNAAVRDYNKFAELSPVRLIKHIYEPGLFVVEYPEKKSNEPEPELTTVRKDIVLPPQKTEVSTAPAPVTTTPATSRTEGRVIHDTIKVTDIIRIETRRSDTVYIEKHDTIYRDGPGDKMLSMDGYASNNLVFLLDVSGSMNTGQKLPLLKKSMLLLLKILRAEDHVSIVVYSGKAKVALAPTSAKEQEKIKKVIENLKSEGDTDGNAGIRLAYKTADGNYIRGGNNRIVLATDGEFPVSDETRDMITKFGSQDIFLSVFNFGNKAQSIQSLQKLSALGKGNFSTITAKNSDVKLIAEAKGKKKQ